MLIVKLNGSRCELDQRESFVNILHSFISHEVASSIHSGGSVASPYLLIIHNIVPIRLYDEGYLGV